MTPARPLLPFVRDAGGGRDPPSFQAMRARADARARRDPPSICQGSWGAQARPTEPPGAPLACWGGPQSSKLENPGERLPICRGRTHNHIRSPRLASSRRCCLNPFICRGCSGAAVTRTELPADHCPCQGFPRARGSLAVLLRASSENDPTLAPNVDAMSRSPSQCTAKRPNR